MNPPLRNPSDAAKYREQYLSNLALETSNNQKNYNANAIYQRTGQTPTQPPDMRSLEDKIADIESQRIMLVSQLKQLTDGFIAQGIATSLKPEEVTFAVQNFPHILTQLKPRYALGVPKEVFINFLRTLMKRAETAIGVEMGLQQSTGESILLSLKNIENVLTNKSQLRELKQKVEKMPESPLKEATIRRIINLEESLFTPDEITKLNSLDPLQQEGFIKLLNEYMANYPTREQIDNELRNIERYEQQGPITREEAGTALESINQVIPPLVGVEIEQIKEDLNNAGQEQPSSGQPATRISVYYEPNELIEAKNTITGLVSDFEKSDDPDQKKQIINEMKNVFNRYGIEYQFRTNASPASINKKFKEWYDKQVSQLDPEERAAMEGHGLKKKIRGKGLSKPVARMEGQYVKPKAYVQLGRYLLNNHRLKDGILMIKTPSGLAIPELPTEKISESLTDVIKHIKGGKIPEFDMLSNLTELEKKKLKTIVKKCQLDISVPNPDMKQEQHENRRFELLRGEISAGNDNPKIAKELKSLIVKFIHDGRLPRRQAHEILLDLTSMGY